MLRSCSTHGPWCSSGAERMATIGPVSTNTCLFKTHQIHRSVLDSY